MFTRVVLVSAATLVAAIALPASPGWAQQPKVLTFDADRPDAAPAGFQFSHALKKGKAGTWVIKADDAERKGVLAQMDGSDKTSARFPVAVLSDGAVADADISVKYKPISGTVDMAAGLVWRYQDEDNYYIVRANALEDNVVLYKVEKGRRIDLPLKGQGRTYGAKSPVPKNQWGVLRVVAAGDTFTVFNNGQELYQVQDTTFSKAGRIGVWTKADSVTYFDDLTIATK